MSAEDDEVEWWYAVQHAYAVLPCEVLADVFDSPRGRAAARRAHVSASVASALARWVDDGGRVL